MVAITHQIDEEAGCVAEGAAAPSRIGVEQRRVPQRHQLLAAWRVVSFHHLDLEPAEAGGQLARVSDRRRGEDERRPRSVMSGDASKPPEQMGHMAAEYATQVCISSTTTNRSRTRKSAHR